MYLIIQKCARMHRSARRAGNPSDSSRVPVALHQTRTWPAGGESLPYEYVANRLHHLRHRSRPQRGRAEPPGAHHPVPARTENPSPPHPAAAAVLARCPSAGPLPAAVAARASCPARDYFQFARVGGPPPPPPLAAAASLCRCRLGRCPCGALWVALLCRTLQIAGPPLGPPGGRIARLH
jgi:hypothetical protein